MTLVLATRNNEKIVVGADSLRGRLDSSDLSLDAKKMYEITRNCVVLVAGSGFNADRVDQFLLDFIDCVSEKALTDVEPIVRLLSQVASRRIAGQVEPGNLVFIVSGFSDLAPRLFLLHSDSGFQRAEFNTAYVAAGKDEFARSVCDELGVNRQMTTRQLKSAVNEVLNRAVNQFPNEVGGQLNIKTLSA